MLKITDAKITEMMPYDEKLVLELLKELDSELDSNIKDLLPKTPIQKVEFKLLDSSSAFANTIRRILIDELTVGCLDFSYDDWETDDDFLRKDEIRKNINLLPIDQKEYKEIDAKKTNIFLFKHNNTNEILDVISGDIEIGDKNSKSKADNLVPIDNIPILSLRPGKTIKIKKLTFLEGQNRENASRFSLLTNITYKPLDIVPYDMFKKTGTRTIEHEYKDFAISFKTVGNITGKEVIDMVTEHVVKNINIMQNSIQEFSKHETKTYYYSENLTVEKLDNMLIYIFPKQYITLTRLIGKKCFKLDPNLQFIVATIDRFDNDDGIIKIIHAEPSKLLLKACAESIKDIEQWQKVMSSIKVEKQ